MLKAFKYTLSPNIKQQMVLNKTFGCVRYFWNKQVELFNSYNKDSNPIVNFKTSTEIRKENGWMLEVSAAAIQQKVIAHAQLHGWKMSMISKEAHPCPVPDICGRTLYDAYLGKKVGAGSIAIIERFFANLNKEQIILDDN